MGTKITNQQYKFRIKELSKELDITMEQLAASLNVSHKTIWLWANTKLDDKNSIPSDMMVRLSCILLCTVDDIYNEAALRNLAMEVA